MPEFIRLGKSGPQVRYVNLAAVQSIRWDPDNVDASGDTTIYLETMHGTTHFPVTQQELANLKETFIYGDRDLVAEREEAEREIAEWEAEKAAQEEMVKKAFTNPLTEAVNEEKKKVA